MQLLGSIILRNLLLSMDLQYFWGVFLGEFA